MTGVRVQDDGRHGRKIVRRVFLSKKIMDIRKNIGGADRAIRFVLAAGLIGLLVTHVLGTGGKEILGWAAVAVLLITALDQTSPAYILFGINTRKRKGKQLRRVVE
jgi:hypothetical protein